MADDLHAIVQRMIDAGESEDNIAAVIKAYKPALPPDPDVQTRGMRLIARGSGGLVPTLKQTDELGNEVGGMPEGPAKNFLRNTVQNPISQGAAHPTTVGDISGLLLPDAPGAWSGAMRGASDTAAAARDLVSRTHVHPSALVKVLGDLDLTKPFKSLSHVGEVVTVDPKPAAPMFPHQMPPAVDTGMPADWAQTATATPAPVATPASPSRLTAAEVAQLQKQGFAPRVIERIQQRLVPVASHAPAPVQTPPPNVADVPISQPLGQPRVIGPANRWTLKGALQRETPWQGQALEDWHSGAEPGSIDASRQSARHMEIKNLDARYKQLLDDPKAAWWLPFAGGGAVGLRQMMLGQMHGDE